MGGLFSSNPPPTNILVDFQNPPTPADAPLVKLFEQTNQVLIRSQSLVKDLEQYTGCEELIRLAMSKPNDQATQIAAFEGMFPNVNRIRDFYQIGKDVDEVFGKLIRIFVETESLEDHSALLQQFAAILNFALTFDRCKMMRPAVQNDFSFYRRALGKNSRHPGIPVSDIEANNISMFIAQAAPIISTLAITADNLQRQVQVTQFLAHFAHICCANVMADKSKSPVTSRFPLTAMVVAFVLYDQISPNGVFNSSQIQLKTCISQLKVLAPEDRVGLCDALQYSTKTFNKAPDSIKKMITSR